MKTDSSHMLFIIHYIVISISLIMPQKKGTPSTTTTTTTNNNTDRNTNNSNIDGNSNNSKKRKNGSSDGSSIKLLKQRQSANIQIDHSKKTYDNVDETK